MGKEQLEDKIEDIKKLEPSNPIYQHAFRTLFGRKEKYLNFDAEDIKGEVKNITNDLEKLKINKITITNFNKAIDVVKDFEKYGFRKESVIDIKTGAFIYFMDKGYEDFETEVAIFLIKEEQDAN